MCALKRMDALAPRPGPGLFFHYVAGITPPYRKNKPPHIYATEFINRPFGGFILTEPLIAYVFVRANRHMCEINYKLISLYVV